MLAALLPQDSVANMLVSGVAALLKLTREGFKENHPGGAIGGAKA
jgi:hypothetical protein